jgi:RHS repeat-associated protein
VLNPVVGLTESNGTLVSTYQYDSYGNLTSSTGTVANPWRFAGGYFDSSTGLYKFGARYDDPTLGRWSQQDPVRGHLDDPNSLNRYVYVSDDPVNLTDPSGELPCALAQIIITPTGLPGEFNIYLVIIGLGANIDKWGGTFYTLGGLVPIVLYLLELDVNSPIYVYTIKGLAFGKGSSNILASKSTNTNDITDSLSEPLTK